MKLIYSVLFNVYSMTKNAKNYRHLILSLTIATVFTLGIVAISNTNTVTAEVHPITPTGEEVVPYEGYVGQVTPTAVNCNVDSNVVAWVTNNGGTVGDYLTIADDIENNLGVTARNVQLTGPVPDCIVKLVVTHGASQCLGDIGAGPRATIIDWVDNQGGELLILEEHSSFCGGGSAALTANWGAVRQSNTAAGCGSPGENYDATEFDATHPIMAGVTSMNMQCGTDFISDGTLATVILDSTNNRPVMLAGPVNDGCVVITGDSNWMGDPSNNININDSRIAANNVFAFLNDCTTNSPPVVTAALVPICDDDDEGLFTVVFTATDPDNNIVDVDVELNGIPVTNGQVVELEIDDETVVENDDDILEIQAPSFELVVTATDSEGLSTTATATPTFAECPDDDDDDDDDD